MNFLNDIEKKNNYGTKRIIKLLLFYKCICWTCLFTDDSNESSLRICKTYVREKQIDSNLLSEDWQENKDVFSVKCVLFHQMISKSLSRWIVTANSYIKKHQVFGIAPSV